MYKPPPSGGAKLSYLRVTSGNFLNDLSQYVKILF